MDKLFGKVVIVIDGDTFEMEVSRVKKNEEHSYKKRERIRIFGENAPELNTVNGQLAKNALERKWLNKTVQVTVHSRDSFGRIVGDVSSI